MKINKAREYQSRLDELARHAWKERLEEALLFYRPEAELGQLVESGEPVMLSNIDLHLAPQDRARQQALEKLCQPHWIRGFEGKEVELRDLLDDALEGLSLLELAVEASYIDVHTVLPFARSALVQLAWSHGVQTFIRSYEYDAVMHLGARCGVVFFEPKEQPPNIDPELEIGFPAFASAYTRFKTDPAIQAWTRVLDDFYYRDLDGPVPEDRHKRFARYLENRDIELSLQARQLFEQRLAGALQFVEHLGRYLKDVEPEHRLSYARAFRYWLARHHGYRQEGRPSFTRVDQPCWADRLRKTMSNRSSLDIAVGAYCPDETLRPAVTEAIAAEFELLSNELQDITMKLLARKAA